MSVTGVVGNYQGRLSRSGHFNAPNEHAQKGNAA
jgi:hypothetical protein